MGKDKGRFDVCGFESSRFVGQRGQMLTDILKT